MLIHNLRLVACIFLSTSTVALGKRNFQPNEPVKLYANKVSKNCSNGVTSAACNLISSTLLHVFDDR